MSSSTRSTTPDKYGPLVLKAQQGDQRAFDLLLRIFRPLLLAVTVDLLAPGVDRDDMVQEARLGIWDAVNRYDPSKGLFTSFVRLVVQRHLFTYIKTCRRAKRSMLNEADSLDDAYDNDGCGNIADIRGVSQDPVDIIIARDDTYRLKQALSRHLTTQEHQCVLLHAQGIKYSEIATQLGVTRKSVDNALYRALRRKAPKIRSDYDGDTD